jgi:regulatory protein
MAPAAHSIRLGVRQRLWHNQGVDGSKKADWRSGKGGRRPPRPLGPEALNELALAYVARFATSRAKLAAYLSRKLKERGWEGDGEADVNALAERLVGLGFIDDRAFADAKAGSLLRRGYGSQRVSAALSAAGISEEDRSEAMDLAADGAFAAALRFAERKRLGPFAPEPLDRDQRSKALAAMMRAGHRFDLARRIVEAAPGEDIEEG